MNRIITIGREFGSGGRELGRRLSEKLGIAYYDREIVAEIAKRTSLSENYVQQIVERKPIVAFPIHVGRSFNIPLLSPVWEQGQAVYQEQHTIIREMARKSDCVIVGRCADYILREQGPFRLFVYADMAARIARCRANGLLNGEDAEGMTDQELRRHILDIDKNRAKYYDFYTGQTWGDRVNYDLCVNTTHSIDSSPRRIDIEKMAELIAGLLG